MSKSKTRRYHKKSIKRKNSKTRKGGFFGFFSSKKVAPQECNLDNVNQMGDYKDLHGLYQKCCPKGMFGTKNSSSLCKTIDQKFQQSWKAKNDALEYQGDETDPEKVEMLKNNPVPGAKRDCKALNVDNIYNKETLESLYGECCPKGFFGNKNSSPNCKKMDAKMAQLNTSNASSQPAKEYQAVPLNEPQEPFNEERNIQGGRKNKKSKKTRRHRRK